MEESRYIGDLIKQVQGINEFTTERLDDEQSIRDTLLDQTKYLGSQLELKKSIKRSADSIYSIQSDILYQENQALGTREGYIKIQKNIDKIDKQINSLERDKDFLLKNESKISKDLVNSINQQISEAKRIKSQLKDQAEVSSKTRKNLGTSTFQLFSEILSNVGGKASQIAKPFEAAAEASRSAVEPLIARNQAISKFRSARSELSSIAKGSVKATDSLSRKLGLLGKNGEVLTGDAAKEAAQNALEVGDKMGGPINQASIHAKGLGEGFKVIGLALAAAAGPFGMLMSLFKLARMVVEEMFKASQMTAEFSRNLLISRDQSRKLYMDSFKIMDKYNKTEAIEGRNMILREDMFKAHEAINSSLGLQMNFMTGFDEAMSMDVAEVGNLMKYFDLSAENAGRVFIDAQISGQSVKEFSENLYGELAMMGARTGVMMDFNKLINEAANMSGRLRHEMGGTIDNIAKSIYNTRLAGLNLEAASGSHTKLLDVMQSISAERDLEQLTGVDINGNRLRKLAMFGTQKELLSAIMSEANKLGGFLNLTRTQQEAFSKLVGVSSNDIIDMIYKGKEMAAVQANHAKMMEMFEEEKNRLLAMGIDISNEAAFMEKYNLAERYNMLVELGASDEQIKKRLFLQVQRTKQEESANEKFQRAIGILKDKLVRFVGDGKPLDTIIKRITDFLNSKAVRTLMGVSNTEYLDGVVRTDIDENTMKILSNEVKYAIQNAAEGMQIFYNPLTGEVVEREYGDFAHIEGMIREFINQEGDDLFTQIVQETGGMYVPHGYGGLRDGQYFDDPNFKGLDMTNAIKALTYHLGGIDQTIQYALVTTGYTKGRHPKEIKGKGPDFFRDLTDFDYDEVMKAEYERRGSSFEKDSKMIFDALPPELRLLAETGELQAVLQEMFVMNMKGETREGTSLTEQGFINVTKVQLVNNNLLDFQLQNQLTEEELNSAVYLMEQRILYALIADATDQAEYLAQSHQNMLFAYLKDYGKSSEDIVYMKMSSRHATGNVLHFSKREILDKYHREHGTMSLNLGAGLDPSRQTKFHSDMNALQQWAAMIEAYQEGGTFSDVYEGAYTPNFSEIGRGFERFGEELHKGFVEPVVEGFEAASEFVEDTYEKIETKVKTTYNNVKTKAKKKWKETKKFFSSLNPFDDFIQEPGLSPTGFGKGQLDIGNNFSNDEQIIQLLEELVVSLEQQPNKVDLDANAIGIGLATTATSIGTTVR